MGEFSFNDRLLLGFREGDHRCFAIIFHLNYRTLVALALRHTRDKPSAEDIVQESFIKLWELRSAFQTIATIKAFLHNATFIGCTQHKKRITLQRRQHRRLSKHLLQQARAQKELSEPELLSKVLAAVQTLPRQCREVVNLIYAVGMEEKEVAATLRMSISAVRNERLRAIFLLKKRLLNDSTAGAGQHLSLLGFINAASLRTLVYEFVPREPASISPMTRFRVLHILSRGAAAAAMVVMVGAAWYITFDRPLSKEKASSQSFTAPNKLRQTSSFIDSSTLVTPLAVAEEPPRHKPVAGQKRRHKHAAQDDRSDSIQLVAHHTARTSESVDSTTGGRYIAAVREPGTSEQAFMMNGRYPSADSGNQSDSTKPVAYHVIAAPADKPVFTLLDDSTYVWLYPGSTLRYPTIFYGNERQVWFTGQGYFEVKGNDSRPFIVSTATKQVIAMNGVFNIREYPGEVFRRISLPRDDVEIRDLSVR